MQAYEATLGGGVHDDANDDAAYDEQDMKALRFHGMLGHTFFVVDGPLGRRRVRGECSSIEDARRVAASVIFNPEAPKIYEKVKSRRRSGPKFLFQPRGL
jgi:hypothetical protein